MFPAEIYRAPELGERAFGNEVEKGGLFAAWEQPDLFGEEILAAFRSLRETDRWQTRATFVRLPNTVGAIGRVFTQSTQVSHQQSLPLMGHRAR